METSGLLWSILPPTTDGCCLGSPTSSTSPHSPILSICKNKTKQKQQLLMPLPVKNPSLPWVFIASDDLLPHLSQCVVTKLRPLTKAELGSNPGSGSFYTPESALSDHSWWHPTWVCHLYGNCSTPLYHHTSLWLFYFYYETLGVLLGLSQPQFPHP